MELRQFIFNPVGVNCYLLWDESKEAVLIDAAVLFPEEKEELKNFIAQQGLQIKGTASLCGCYRKFFCLLLLLKR